MHCEGCAKKIKKVVRHFEGINDSLFRDFPSKINHYSEQLPNRALILVELVTGVEDVKADISANKLTVTGKVDPAKLRDKLAEKTKKKVELVSPQPKKDDAAAAAGDKPLPEKKSEEKKSDDKNKKDEEEKPKEVI